MEVGIIIEGVHGLKVNIASVRLVGHLKADHAFEIAYSTDKNFPHIQERVLEELLDRDIVFGLQLWCERVTTPEDRAITFG